MPDGVTFTVTTKDVRLGLEALQYSLDPARLRQYLGNSVTEYFQDITEQTFVNQGARRPRKWTKLRPATQQIRKRMGFSPASPINERTGAMRDWATSQEAAILEAGDGIEIRYPDAMPTGDMNNKVRAAQVGGVVGNRAFPARPIFWLREDDAELVLQDVANFMAQEWD